MIPPLNLPIHMWTPHVDRQIEWRNSHCGGIPSFLRPQKALSTGDFFILSKYLIKSQRPSPASNVPQRQQKSMLPTVYWKIPQTVQNAIINATSRMNPKPDKHSP